MRAKSFRAILHSGTTVPSNGKLVFRICAGYLALNLIGLYLARLWSLDRPLFNLDYLVAGLVYVWVSRRVAAVLFAAFVILEVIHLFIPTYFFSKQAFSVLFWARSAAEWPFSVLAAAALTTAVFLLAVAGLFRRYRLSWSNRLAATGWILGLLFLLLAADWLNGSFNLRRGDSSRLEVNVAGSPAHLICQQTLAAMLDTPAVLTPIPMRSTATGRYFSGFLPQSSLPSDPEKRLDDFPVAAVKDRLPDKMVLILVESLSVLAADPRLEGWEKPFRRLDGRYRIESGTLDWTGATLRGEIRSLCWQSMDGVRIGSPPIAIPAIFKSLGYETASFHGFYRTMYERNRLYPLLGFDRSVFLEDMLKAGNVPISGTLFRGAQDSFVASLVHQEILRPGKRLVYWLTLSSHVPESVSFAGLLATPFEHEQMNTLPPAVWAHTVICRRTLESIAEIAADESLGNCDFIIVGDHSVPVTNMKLKKYYVPNQVPYLILRHPGEANLEAGIGNGRGGP